MHRMTAPELEAVRAAVLGFTGVSEPKYDGFSLAQVCLHTSSLMNFLSDQGYYNLRILSNGKIIGLQDQIYTTGIVVGLTKDTYECRYCYEQIQDAAAACATWEGVDHPSGPWIKLKGTYNGKLVDMLNPSFA